MFNPTLTFNNLILIKNIIINKTFKLYIFFYNIIDIYIYYY